MKVGETYEDGMLDITGALIAEVSISVGPNGAVIHVSTEEGTRLRICRISGDVHIIDHRPKARRTTR